MPTCKQCNKKFPSRIMVDGKEKYLQLRKYCLECKPYLSIEQKKEQWKRDSKRTSVCKRCGKEFVVCNNGNLKTCNACFANANRKSRKQKAIEYLGGKCVFCGYRKYKGSLDFHHINPQNKSFGISNNLNLTWEKLTEELDKCILVCRNCHGELHGGIRIITEDIINKSKITDKYSEIQILSDNYIPEPQKHYCSLCGKEVRWKANKCQECFNKTRPTKIPWPPIEELKERLSHSNYSKLGRELGISDNALRKHLSRN